jgi:hypothetical protein
MPHEVMAKSDEEFLIMARELADCSKQLSMGLGVNIGGEVLLVNPMYRCVGFRKSSTR